MIEEGTTQANEQTINPYEKNHIGFENALNLTEGTDKKLTKKLIIKPYTYIDENGKPVLMTEKEYLAKKKAIEEEQEKERQAQIKDEQERKHQEEREDTAWQRSIQDYIKAGGNPGATSTSLTPASSNAKNEHKNAELDEERKKRMLEQFLKELELETKISENEKDRMVKVFASLIGASALLTKILR